MDASLIAHDCTGNEEQEHSTVTNENKEEHEMLKLSSQQVQQQSNINQSSMTTGSQNEGNKKSTVRVTKAGITLITVLSLVVVILLISLIAIVLSIISYCNNTSDSHNEDTNISQLLIQLEEAKKLANANLNVRLQHCGPGEWHRIALLNLSDPLGQCPSVWREYNRQFRACGRPTSMYGSRPAKFYPTNRQYNKVCGRVIAIQVASPDAFHSDTSINEGYMDGVSITYGSPRNHIWSYVGSYSEIATGHNVCPCDYSSATQPPSFVSKNYYCESGNPTREWRGHVFPNDKLWDGEHCSNEGTCCTGANTPPWFNVNLSSPTSADIEVRIMGSESTENEDTPIELLELFVQ